VRLSRGRLVGAPEFVARAGNWALRTELKVVMGVVGRGGGAVFGLSILIEYRGVDTVRFPSA
jgi:hypothetical protein